MSTIYAYRARDRTGKVLSGTILAENGAQAARFVRDKGLYITKINTLRQSSRLLAFFFNQLPITNKELAIYCRQFSVMLIAGLPLLSCLNILVEQTENARIKRATIEVIGRIQAGNTLSAAFGEYPDVFPVVMTKMIAAGEVGGVLDNVLDRVAIYFEREYKLREKVKSALTYPLFVMGFGLISAAFMAIFVLPAFIQLFTDMKVELPLLTRFIIRVAAFFKDHYLLVFSGCFLASVGFAALRRCSAMRKPVEQFIFRLPVIGLLTRRTVLARFCRTLSTLMRGGVPVLAALEVVKETTANTIMIDALSRAEACVSGGLGLAGPLAAHHLFTPMALQLIAVGEETGTLDKMLDTVADFYERDVEDTMSRLGSLIEPFLIGAIGIVIGLLVAAIALPMFDVISNFGMRPFSEN
ncbi:MAG: Type secretion system protein [Firmicutes bacterium]|nr:Type secretion system protein [Bacillota bacterium]